MNYAFDIIMEAINELSDDGFDLFMSMLDDDEFEFVKSSLEGVKDESLLGEEKNDEELAAQARRNNNAVKLTKTTKNSLRVHHKKTQNVGTPNELKEKQLARKEGQMRRNGILNFDPRIRNSAVAMDVHRTAVKYDSNR